MIKKIICPTDFSETATNAIHYAAKLAQVFGAELKLINVQRIHPVSAVVSMREGIDPGSAENSHLAAERLKDVCTEINKMFKISTDYEVDITATSIQKVISASGVENTIIVMGTNGIDDTFQYFFGTNTNNVIKKSKCPVFIIPESASYKSIKKIVFAWDYSPDAFPSFTFLNELMATFNPEFTFLHISKHLSDISEDVFKALRSEVKPLLGQSVNVQFEQIYSEDITSGLDQYMTHANADLLTLFFYDRGEIPNLFHGTITKRIVNSAKYPVLVLHI